MAALIILLVLMVNAHAGRFEYSKLQKNRHHHHISQHKHPKKNTPFTAQLGPRPFYLVGQMQDSPLKRALKQCSNGPFYTTGFSIGHRGAAMQFPEHTKESYTAAAKMGAGILECDVTFTKDRELVCRHSQCDLATTTNILVTNLASKCSSPFTPSNATTGAPATARCCTSDITLAEFKTLCGKMDGANPLAATPEEYLGGTVNWRTDLYSSCATLVSHKESIKLFQQLGTQYTPELKSPSVSMPFEGDYTQEMYAQQMISEYVEAGISSKKVWPQSFSLEDIKFWVNSNSRFSRQAVFLDDSADDPAFTATLEYFTQLKAGGLNIIAPPIPALLTLDANKNITPSNYALLAQEAGLDIITWTLERSGRIVEDVKGSDTYYYSSVLEAMNHDGDIFVALDVLAKQVGVIGVFSDWPATVTYYANCMNL